MDRRNPQECIHCRAVLADAFSRWEIVGRKRIWGPFCRPCYVQNPWPDNLSIGEEVLDADGRPWRVLSRPIAGPSLGNPADGLFQALDGNRGQRYGEHMKTPLAYPSASGPSFGSRVLCWLGLHPYGALTDLATCGDCGRFVL